MSQAELNRATLARQLLLERSSIPVAEALEHLVGLQAQTANTWYTGLWSRLQAFNPCSASRMLEERDIVRIALMRSTIHLVTAQDALRLRPVLQSAIARPMGGRGRAGLRNRGYDDIAAAGRELLDAEPLTSAELGDRLAMRWPEEEPNNLVMAVRVGIPLVQVPPRGSWGRAGAAKHVPLETWLHRPLSSKYTVDDVVLRYLGAFGPATPADAQVWSGLARLPEVFDRLRPRLCTFRAEDGRELFDLPDAPRPAGDSPAPPRFLYDFDNVLLSHADRSRFVSDKRKTWMLSVARRFAWGALLVNGTVAGVWRLERHRDSPVVVIKLAEPLSREDDAAVTEEARGLAALWAPESAADVRVTVDPPDPS